MIKFEEAISRVNSEQDFVLYWRGWKKMFYLLYV